MFVSPMLLHKIDIPFDNEQFITELKLDGIRLILSKMNNTVKIYTRHNNDVTFAFSELTDINIADGTILDGELIVPGEGGKPDFEAMMERFKSSKSEHKVQFCVFDILYYKNESITSLPLLERKQLLSSILPKNNPYIVEVQWLKGNAGQYFELIKQNGLEGVVLKKANSKYEINKRSKNWLKLINYQYEEIWITGLRKGEFGLFISFLDGRSAGVMEFMTIENRKIFYKHVNSHKREETDKAVYLQIPLKCKVKYRNLTKNGKLRIPSFHEWTS